MGHLSLSSFEGDFTSSPVIHCSMVIYSSSWVQVGVCINIHAKGWAIHRAGSVRGLVSVVMVEKGTGVSDGGRSWGVFISKKGSWARVMAR